MIRPIRKLHEDMAKDAMTKCIGKEEIVKELFNYIEYLELSIGSCDKCELLQKCDVFAPKGEPKYPNLCGKHLMPVKKDFFCADFQPKEAEWF